MITKLPLTSPVLSGIGMALPAQSVLSDDIDAKINKPRGWLRKSCGIISRYVTSAHETQEKLGTSAAIKALEEAGITIDQIDLLLFGAAVGRQPIPATAPLIKRELGAESFSFAAYDVNATCLSALTALDVAAMQIASGRAQHVLVVVSEIASRALPWLNDPKTAGIFGDGAAAIVVSAADGNIKGPRFGGFRMETYAQGYDACALPAGGTRFDFKKEPEFFAARSVFEMDGRELYKLSAKVMPGFIDRLLEGVGWRQSDIDLVIPHQASPHALAHISKRCGFSQEVIFNCIANLGNQVAASMPIALFKAREAGRLKSGMRIMMIGTSAGISLGGAVLEV